MTTETNSVLNTVKEAFAPVTDAFKNIQNMEVPEAAREFVKKQAETAKVRAADMLRRLREGDRRRSRPPLPVRSPRPPRSAATSSRRSIRTPRRSSPASTSSRPPSRSTKPSRSSRTWSVPAAKCSCRGPRRRPNISASSSPMAPRPLRTTSPRSTPRPPDRVLS